MCDLIIRKYEGCSLEAILWSIFASLFLVIEFLFLSHAIGLIYIFDSNTHSSKTDIWLFLLVSLLFMVPGFYLLIKRAKQVGASFIIYDDRIVYKAWLGKKKTLYLCEHTNINEYRISNKCNCQQSKEAEINCIPLTMVKTKPMYEDLSKTLEQIIKHID